MSLSSEHPCRHFSLAEIQLATKNFGQEMIIGKGGFSKVYKGFINDGGTTVAIKQLDCISRQGASEFWTEIKKLSKVGTVKLLWNSGGDNRPDLSFDKSASLECLFSLAYVSLAEASKPDLSFGCSWGDYTLSCPPSLVSAKLAYRLTVTLFRVFQTLCKLYDWFSFDKRRSPFPFFINDNLSCMKHWKSGFFLIDRQAIPDVMVWRHPDVAINDPRPAAGSFNMADIHRLIAHVIKIRDMHEGVLVLSRLSYVWKSCVCDLVLQGVDGNVMGIHDFLYLLEWTGAEDPTPEDLAIGTPSSKIVAKAKASQKRKSSTSSATLSHVAKHTSDADDDACVEILLVTPLRSAAVIPSLGNQGGSSAAPTAEDSRGKGIMVDDATAPSASASRQRPSSILAPSFRDVSGDVIHTDFFPFSTSPYYATYPEDGVAENCEFTQEEWDAPYRPTFGVLMKEVFRDLAICKTIEERVASLTGLELQVSALKKQVSGLNDKLSSSNASFAKSKAKGKERKKKIKSLTKSVDNLHSEGLVQKFLASNEFSRDEFAAVLKKMANFMPGAQDRLVEASLLISQTDYAFFNKISEHATKPLSVIL
ncbi:reverse transcriptase domain-containing protein [Tanacetum coccineum]